MHKSVSTLPIITYSILLFMALNLKIGVIGVADCIATLGLFFYFAKGRTQRKLPSNMLLMISVPINMFLIDISVKIIFYGETANFDSFEMILKLLMFFVYRNVFANQNLMGANYDLILWILMLPFFVSMAMYLNPGINQIILQFYKVPAYSNASRFGGIYGMNVNTFGFYTTCVLLITVLLKRYSKISGFTTAFCIIGAFLMTFLSGMRAGIIALSIAFLITRFIKMNEKGRVYISIKKRSIKLFKYSITILIVLAIIAFILTKFIPKGILLQIKYRFSIDKLLNDIFLTGIAADSNIYVTGRYLEKQISLCRNRSILWGYDIEASYVDIGYVDLFLRHGVIGLAAIFFFSVFLFKEIKNSRYNNDFLFVIAFALIISIKGVFVADTKFIILFSFIFVCLEQFAAQTTLQNRHLIGYGERKQS